MRLSDPNLLPKAKPSKPKKAKEPKKSAPRREETNWLERRHLHVETTETSWAFNPNTQFEIETNERCADYVFTTPAGKFEARIPYRTVIEIHIED